MTFQRTCRYTTAAPPCHESAQQRHVEDDVCTCEECLNAEVLVERFRVEAVCDAEEAVWVIHHQVVLVTFELTLDDALRAKVRPGGSSGEVRPGWEQMVELLIRRSGRGVQLDAGAFSVMPEAVLITRMPCYLTVINAGWHSPFATRQPEPAVVVCPLAPSNPKPLRARAQRVAVVHACE